jgi:Bacterial TSP3 repeat
MQSGGTDPTGQSDLDLTVTGAGDSGSPVPPRASHVIDADDQCRAVAGATRSGCPDGDGVADGADNFVRHPNSNQADLDRDGKGDLCDSDIDGDGHSNAKERKHGTDPFNPSSYPRRPGSR